MDDDEARELMEDVVAEKQEDADVRRLIKGGNALEDGGPGEADLVLTFKAVSYQEWRDSFPAKRWASGYPGAEGTMYYRLVDAVPMASVIGEEFKRGWNRGMAGIAPNPDSLEARVTRLEVLFGLKKEA